MSLQVNDNSIILTSDAESYRLSTSSASRVSCDGTGILPRILRLYITDNESTIVVCLLRVNWQRQTVRTCPLIDCWLTRISSDIEINRSYHKHEP